MSTRFGAALVTVLLGASAGVVASLATSTFLAHREAARATPANVLVVPLGATVATSEHPSGPAPTPAPQASVAAQAPPAAPPRAAPPAPSETRAQEHARLVAAARVEPIDPSWAARSARSLDDDLSKLAAASGFNVVDVACHTTSCLATLEWPSYADARGGYARALREPYALNCPRRIVVDPPGDSPSARVQATLLFDCVEQRAAAR
jgi:hypothetical protein